MAKLYSHVCKRCGITFTLTIDRPERKYCSNQCKFEESRKIPEPRLCACGCGEEIARKRFSKRFPESFVRGHQFRGERNTNWNKEDAYIATDSGYRFIRHSTHPNTNKNGFIREHVFVMSEHLGRPIQKSEVVHHINQNKLDNRIENLQIMSIAEHTSLHHKGLIKPNSLKNLKSRNV